VLLLSFITGAAACHVTSVRRDLRFVVAASAASRLLGIFNLYVER